jgi:hypothetical protein
MAASMWFNSCLNCSSTFDRSMTFPKRIVRLSTDLYRENLSRAWEDTYGTVSDVCCQKDGIAWPDIAKLQGGSREDRL